MDCSKIDPVPSLVSVPGSGPDWLHASGGSAAHREASVATTNWEILAIGTT